MRCEEVGDGHAVFVKGSMAVEKLPELRTLLVCTPRGDVTFTFPASQLAALRDAIDEVLATAGGDPEEVLTVYAPNEMAEAIHGTNYN
jgi:hypothetical protein